MKKLFLFLTLLIFSFHYSNNNVLIYKNDLKEVKTHTVIIHKKYNDKIYDLKISVGEGFLGKVTSFSIEVLDNGSEFKNLIVNNREKIKSNLLEIITNSNSLQRSAIGPVLTVGNCVSNCTKTWQCYDQPTQTGTALCALDCVLECAGA
ncbi:hypothetical protein ASG22_15910 [Chryseobacterium sp. Leaf405]|uniref:hypothetical protein n=1 Tax=Chryseobacterium sp. Leaf405 TaxID=1736367 RepID=UPI0006F7C385|nr:hypothetical protein [Chryseobacterium sp. Leaf405]KQT21638.1 hypothetical protein ASG22_15910 [Chryseobacterium sp. Leaf405]